jgi:hypothetical protein
MCRNIRNAEESENQRRNTHQDRYLAGITKKAEEAAEKNPAHIDPGQEISRTRGSQERLGDQQATN